MSTLTTNYLTPTGREEDWRFTPLSRLAGLHDSAIEIGEGIAFDLPILPAGVSFEVLDRSLVTASSETKDLVISRVRETVTHIGTVKIAANSEIADPIYLNRKASSGKPLFSRTIITAGANSHATVVVENNGIEILGEEIEIILEPGSNLTFISLQEWDAQSVHVGRHHAIIGKDASFKSFVVTIGGSVVRLLPTVEYSGERSSAELNGVYFATAGQHLEHRIHVDHNIPNAKSRVNYKGALSGNNARTVWIGDVYIHAAAEGTDTYELNRNLLLSDGARADSVPNLEIETGEIVGAGHASTTGRFDDEQLFYLQSRGISADIARRLVIRGFFSDIIGRIGIPAIEERVMNRIDTELESVGV
ncbi:MAG: Fe-S cluster assembly protein SufD [Actinomycetes bacterium]|jgi:Fe-S cluster assembly protein SufD